MIGLREGIGKNVGVGLATTLLGLSFLPFFLVSHRFIISSKTEVRSSARRERLDTKPTLQPSLSSKNCWRPIRSNSLIPSSKSAKRSKSLSAWKSPRAYEPKILLTSALYSGRILSFASTIVFLNLCNHDETPSNLSVSCFSAPLADCPESSLLADCPGS